MNERLDRTIEKEGRSIPLRLLLSNKVRSKLVRDLLSEDKERMRSNLTKIIMRSDEQWIDDFKELKEELHSMELNERKRHRHQLVSRSTYNNAYYQYLALNSIEKR